MPVAYFKCEACGEEHREIVPQDRRRFDKNERTGNWEFNPTRKVPPLNRERICSCGAHVPEVADPKGVPVRLHFNWMES